MVKVFDSQTGLPSHILKGHRGTIQDLEFSPDGKLLASVGGFDNTLRVWNVDDGSPYAVFPQADDAVMTLAFSAAGKTIATSGYGGEVSLWDVREKKLLKKFSTETNTVRDLQFSTSGKFLATAGEDR